MKDDSSKAAAPDEGKEKGRDVVLLHGRTEDGRGIRALRARESQLELTELRPLKRGAPLHAGEVVRLRPRDELPLLCDVDVLYKADEDGAGKAGPGHAGPPCVASPRYRHNWDAIFGAPAPDAELN